MGDFNRIHFRSIECLRDRSDMLQPVLMTDGMHAVPQGHVLDVQLAGLRVEAHAATFSAMRRAIFSAVLIAADVMMSRLPA